MAKPAPKATPAKIPGSKGSLKTDPMNLTPSPTGVPVGLNTPPAVNGGSPVGGAITVDEIIRRSNYWRDNYNPMRGLSIARLMSLFEQAERGAYSEIQLVLRKAEKRYPVLKGFIEKLLSSIEELEWDVKIMDPLPPGITPAAAKKQQDFLKSRYLLLKNFNESLGQLALADIRGYAVMQKHRFAAGGPNDGAVEELYWIEPWCWARDGFYGDFYYNQNSLFGIGLGSCNTLGEANRIGSDALPRSEFVIRTMDSPLYEIALIALVNWLFTRRNQMAFVEIFILPNSVVIMPPNIPSGQEAAYQAAAEKVAGGISGAIPNGSDVKFPGENKQEAPFAQFCETQDKDMVLAATGGTLTMIAMPTGLGKGASAEHDTAWGKIALQKARRINETLQRDFDVLEIMAEFPGQPVAVYFELGVKDQEDVGALFDNVGKAFAAGLEADPAEISERSGIKLERIVPPPPPENLPPPPEGDPNSGAESDNLKNRLIKLLNRAGIDPAEEFCAALSADLKPLQDRLAAIDKIADPEIQKQKLAALHADMDQLAKDISADPESARVLQTINANALVNGLKNKPAEKS